MSRLLTFPLLFSLVYAEACTPEGPKEEGCPVTGNGDFYGLGVRIGICKDFCLPTALEVY